MKLNESFPDNENQMILHVPQSMVLRNIRLQAKNPEHEKQLYKEKLAFLEEIKNQDPHPKEIFAPCLACFWDVDVYWLHRKKTRVQLLNELSGIFIMENYMDQTGC